MHSSTPTLILWLLGLTIGCSNEPISGPVDLRQVNASANACGEWQVALQAQGSNADLVLTLDGRRHRQWTIDGTQDLEAEGQASPGAQLNMALVASNHTHEFQIDMPKLVVQIDGKVELQQPTSQDRIPLSLSLDAPCQLRVPIDYRFTIDGETHRAGRWMPGSTQVVLILPQLSAGTHTLHVDSSWNDQDIAQWTNEIQIGP